MPIRFSCFAKFTCILLSGVSGLVDMEREIKRFIVNAFFHLFWEHLLSYPIYPAGRVEIGHQRGRLSFFLSLCLLLKNLLISPMYENLRFPRGHTNLGEMLDSGVEANNGGIEKILPINDTKLTLHKY